ncbi:CHAP domain-containing protein [Spirillospora sp. NPDC048911]|uniref:CHAP domain-containing protein n=1 Tax=Spirillospora sp. NPDC048911 TaxID=3364527 RepID=UPI00371E0168
MATTADLLRVARGQLGYRERGDGWTKFGAWYAERHHDGGFARAAWCDMFVGWCAAQAGALKEVGDFAYTPSHAGWFKANGRFDRTPKVGAIVFFDWGGSHSIGAIDHVGIVEAVRGGGEVVTIEGNTSNAVMRRVRRGGIAGYGHPVLTGGGSAPAPGAGAPAWPGRYFRYPPITSGADVRRWQGRMRQRGWRLDADGQYGPRSAQVCRDFQAEKGLEVDGVVGRDTWAAAWTAPIG